eukprot:UN10871
MFYIQQHTTIQHFNFHTITPNFFLFQQTTKQTIFRGNIIEWIYHSIIPPRCILAICANDVHFFSFCSFFQTIILFYYHYFVLSLLPPFLTAYNCAS